MPFEDTKILEFNQNQKSDKAPLTIYPDCKCILEKIDRCKNNREKSSTNHQVNTIHQVFQSLQYLHLRA